MFARPGEGDSGARFGYRSGRDPPMSRFERTTDYWPLFVTLVPPQFSLADVDDYIAEVNALYERRERFATLVETSATATTPGAAERKRLADWQNETVDRIRAYNVFTATIIRSPLIRGAMTAMNWVFRPPNDQVVVGSFEEAFDLCIAKLRVERPTLSDPLERLVSSRPTSARMLLDPAPVRGGARRR